MLLLRFDSMTLSMAVDVPFESVQEITLKLARYEELFKYRYTEKDEGYRQTTQRPPRYVVSLLHVLIKRFGSPHPECRLQLLDWTTGLVH